ncbi:hypothetical protein NWP26_10525, partial [Chrysosporum ovalisporum APH033B]|uniref:hypothetical protein n=1 Tax=Umezakia ovalisporum TaxID=75695 RepID=UPI0024758714
NGLRMSLTILGNEFIIIINYYILILRPEFTIFWAIFITSFLTFNTCEVNPIVNVASHGFSPGSNISLESLVFQPGEMSSLQICQNKDVG